ncbi:hypothetical protein BC830DRAFT_1163791 [Chytriomyces sp. MP71]|nr:hypothetical protein BC830DRAFT_1163791 [Chytriomyces sp. MP71]
MSSSLPASATETMNSLLSSFKPFASTVASQASKGISQGLQVFYITGSRRQRLLCAMHQFTKEAMGRSNDVTELPEAYKTLEVQVDAVTTTSHRSLTRLLTTLRR